MNFFFFISLFLICCACENKKQISREVVQAEAYIDSIPLEQTWTRLTNFTAEVIKEKKLNKLMLVEPSAFAIYNSQALHLDLSPDGALRADRKIEKADLEYIHRWIKECKTNEVCGFDARPLPDFYLIYLKPNIRFIHLTDNAEARWREDFKKQAAKGHDFRGDAIRQINANLFIATERR